MTDEPTEEEIDADFESLPTHCSACGKDPAEGWAFVNDERYCHPDEGFSCYGGGGVA